MWYQYVVSHEIVLTVPLLVSFVRSVTSTAILWPFLCWSLSKVFRQESGQCNEDMRVKIGSLTSRLSSADCFGSAHYDSAVDLFGSCCRLQKVFGTMLSSFLVESRLFCQRRTLWGPIGAHVVFNALACCPVRSPAYFGHQFLYRMCVTEDATWLSYLFTVAYAVFFQGVVIFSLIHVIKWIESKLASADDKPIRDDLAVTNSLGG